MHDIAKNFLTFRQNNSLVLKGVFPFKQTMNVFLLNTSVA
jgi:hypothetical protein